MNRSFALPLLALAALPLRADLFTLSAVNVDALFNPGSDQQTSFVGGTMADVSRTSSSYFFGPGVTNLLGTATSTAFARADAGSLGVSTSVSIQATGATDLLKAKAGAYENPGAGQFFDAYGALARFSTSDLAITPIPGAGVSGSGSVTARLNLNLDGSFTSNPVVSASGTASQSTTVYVSVGFNFTDPVTHFQGGNGFTGSLQVTQALGGAVTFGAGTGLLSGYTGGPLSLSTGATGLPIGTPISLDVSLWAITEVQAGGTLNFAGGADFYHTLSLPTSGSVIDLPAGYTADSPDLHVSDNSYSAVPEPRGWAVLASAGLLGFALARRKSNR